MPPAAEKLGLILIRGEAAGGERAWCRSAVSAQVSAQGFPEPGEQKSSFSRRKVPSLHLHLPAEEQQAQAQRLGPGRPRKRTRCPPGAARRAGQLRAVVGELAPTRLNPFPESPLSCHGSRRRPYPCPRLHHARRKGRMAGKPPRGDRRGQMEAAEQPRGGPLGPGRPCVLLAPAPRAAQAHSRLSTQTGRPLSARVHDVAWISLQLCPAGTTWGPAATPDPFPLSATRTSRPEVHQKLRGPSPRSKQRVCPAQRSGFVGACFEALSRRLPSQKR